MILLVSGMPHQGEHVGALILPGQGNKPNGGPWAADNGAYSGFDEAAFLKMLDRLEPYRSTCLFVACPDVVGDHATTLALFEDWRLRLARWPLGLVAQDGLTSEMVPWSQIAALFIGGTSIWKMSRDAALLIREAKARGKWVHMGRVNTISRITYANSLGCDSIDGSSFSMWADTYIPRAVRMLPHRQEAFE